MPLALEGIKILDLSRVPTGSFCTMILGDLGAEVLKVEAPPGLAERQAGRGLPSQAYTSKKERAFNALDRNKKSIGLNFKTARGKEIFFQLVERYDVVLECYRPGVTRRLGIDYRTVKKRNPRLVYCSLSGYGQEGPRRDTPGHDINYIAGAGVLDLIGEPGRKPAIPLNLIGDYAGGSLFAAIGILAALRARESTGRGQYVDIAMMDGALSLLMASPVAANYFFNGIGPKRGKTVFSGPYPFYSVYRTQDGRYLSIGCAEPWFWENLCRAIGKEEFIPDHLLFHRSLSGKEAKKNQEIKEELEKVFATKTGEQWMEFLGKQDIPVAKVQSLGEVFQDAQVRTRSMVIEVPDGEGGTIKQVGMPIKLSETPGLVRELAPALGEDTDRTLKELDYSPDEIGRLRQCGAVQ